MEKNNKIDRLDRRILFELDHDARQSVSQLARKLRQGRDRVEYRIQRLTERGIITRFVTMVNYAQLGFQVSKTYLRLSGSKEQQRKCVSFLKNHPKVYWIAETHGAWDLFFSVFTKDLKEFHDVQDQILSQFSPILIQFDVYPLVDVFFFKKNYLFKTDDTYVHIGGHQTHQELDPLDLGILSLLCENARTPNTVIAEKFSTSPAVIAYRIERLEQERVIAGYRIDIDLVKLNMVFIKTQVFIQNYTELFSKKLFQFALSHPNITYYIQQIGSCKLELELEVNDFYQQYAIIDELKAQFGKDIKNTESSLIHREYFHWLPKALL